MEHAASALAGSSGRAVWLWRGFLVVPGIRIKDKNNGHLFHCNCKVGLVWFGV